MSANQKILDRLSKAMFPLAVHELGINDYSQNNLATRLSEMAKKGLVVGQYRKGENFKEWSLKESKPTLFFKELPNGQLEFIQ